MAPFCLSRVANGFLEAFRWWIECHFWLVPLACPSVEQEGCGSLSLIMLWYIMPVPGGSFQQELVVATATVCGSDNASPKV